MEVISLSTTTWWILTAIWFIVFLIIVFVVAEYVDRLAKAGDSIGALFGTIAGLIGSIFWPVSIILILILFILSKPVTIVSDWIISKIDKYNDKSAEDE